MTRSAVIRITADTASALRGAQQVGDAYEKAGSRASKAGVNTDKAWDLAGKTSGRIAATGALALGVMEKANMDFDRGMSRAGAAALDTSKNAAQTRAEMDALRSAAVKAGADTAFSATEAADGVTELAKAGVSTRDILQGGLTGALDLAAAGNISVGDSAEYTATALQQFKLRGDQATKVADLLAAGAGKAQGEVADMALALNYAGVPSAQLGVSIEQTAGTIALLASNGLIGERAGTALRGMLGSLTAPSDKAAGLMQDLGLQVFNASGEFIGFDGVAGQLQQRMKGLSDSEKAYYLGKIFGREQMQAANILMREGADGVRKWTKEVDDQGYAGEQAARMMDNLAGDIEKVKGALESAFINGGGGFQDGLRDTAQFAGDVIDKFNDLPDAVQENSVKAVAKLTAAGGLIWTLAKARNTIDDLRGIRGRPGSAAGGALGMAAKAGPVPVFVTNWGPGAPGKPGPGGPVVTPGARSPGSKPTPVGRTRANVAQAGARVAAGLTPLGLAAITVASLSESLDDLGARGPENANKLFKAFEKPKSGTDSFLFGRGNTLKADFDRAIGQVDTGKIGKIGEALDRTLSFTGGTSFTKGLDNVRQLDTELAKVAKNNPGKAFQILDQLSDKTGRSLGELNEALPKTASAFKATESRVGGVGRLLGQTVVPNFRAYQRVLRGMPSQVITKVAAKGADLSRRDIRQLKAAYDLTPKQVRTLVGLLGDGPTKKRLRDVQADLQKTDRSSASPRVRQRGAEKARRDVDNVFAGVRTLGKAEARPKVKQVGAQDAITQMQRVSQRLAALDGDSATTYIRTVRTGVANSNTAADAIADGGTVQGQRYPYGDKVYAFLAPGEEVITNRNGEADRFRADRAAGRIPAYADGGTVGRYADGGKVTSYTSNGFTVTFPAPAVTKASLIAAQGIAAAAAQTTRSYREQKAAELEILQGRQRIREIERSLAETEKKRVRGRDGKDDNPRKKGLQDTHKTIRRRVLRGLERDIARAELAAAKRDLADLRSRRAEIDAGLQKLTEDRTSRLETYQGSLDIFARGGSVMGALAEANRWTADASSYAGTLARLRNAKASPALLRRIDAYAQQGDFRTANRLGQAILNQPGLLGQFNTALGAADQVAGSLAQLTTDPRFLTTAAWNPTSTVVQRQVEVQVQALDVSRVSGEIARLVSHQVAAAVAQL